MNTPSMKEGHRQYLRQECDEIPQRHVVLLWQRFQQHLHHRHLAVSRHSWNTTDRDASVNHGEHGPHPDPRLHTHDQEGQRKVFHCQRRRETLNGPSTAFRSTTENKQHEAHPACLTFNGNRRM